MKKAIFLISFLAVLSLYFQKAEVESQPAQQEEVEKIASCELNRETDQETAKDDETQKELRNLWTEDEESLRKSWGIQPYHQISKEEFQSPLGATRVYRFNQSGLPIVGMTIRLSKDLKGRVNEEENTYRAIPEIDFDSVELKNQALEIRERSVNEGRYEPSQFGVDSAVIFVRKNLSEGQLAFALSAKDHAQGGEPVQLLVRSSDGKVIQKSFGRKEFHF